MSKQLKWLARASDAEGAWPGPESRYYVLCARVLCVRAPTLVGV